MKVDPTKRAPKKQDDPGSRTPKIQHIEVSVKFLIWIKTRCNQGHRTTTLDGSVVMK